MGYDFHITRRERWADDAGPAIEPVEWLELAGSVEKFRPITVFPVSNLNIPPQWHSHCWYGHPIGGGQQGPIFQLVDGRIDFRGDDPATLGFALRLAQALGARIVGDEGEEITLLEILRPADDAFANAVNPFTGERMLNEWEGTMAGTGDEVHLEVVHRSFLGLRQKRERFLLHFVVPAPGRLAEHHGQALRVRGTLSEPGTYGAQGVCSNVLYVMKIIGPPSDHGR